MKYFIIFFLIFACIGTYIYFSQKIAAVNKSIKYVESIPTPTPVFLNAEKLMKQVNDWRVTQGLHQYLISDQLCEIANKRIPEIRQAYGHDKFAIDYKHFPYKISENLMQGGIDEKQTLDAWLGSKPHKETLMKDYKFTCIATDGTNVVQIFSSLGQ